jgi:glycosyltransferase involved in cell wall biosynthesis
MLAPINAEREGGGYSFELDVFHGLLSRIHRTPHTLVVYSANPQPARFGGSQSLTWITVNRVVLRNLMARAVKAFNIVLNKLFCLPSIFENESWLDSYLIRHRVEFFVHLTPTVRTKRAPYLAWVWDLQHRQFPFLPEVSQDGRWVRWEDEFSTSVRRAAVVCVGTSVGKQDVINYYQVPSERVQVLPFPTPSFALEPAEISAVPPKGKLPLAGDYLFYPANFHAHKNHITILKALAILKDEYGLVMHLVLSGADLGNMSHVRRKCKEVGLDAQVHFLGFVEQTSVVWLYRNAFCLVFASLLGPDNLPPLEAFALGCPVIAAGIPGAEEQLGDAALLFPPLDPSSLARAIVTLRDSDTLRSDLISRGQVRARKHTAATTADRIFDILTYFEPMRQCWASDYQYRNPVNVGRSIWG